MIKVKVESNICLFGERERERERAYISLVCQCKKSRNRSFSLLRSSPCCSNDNITEPATMQTVKGPTKIIHKQNPLSL